MATDNKYDRQIRLWGGHGQKKLAESTIIVFGSDALASELLKNLILPGVGQVIIVDDQKVEESDLGNNFFLDHSNVGSFRAEMTLNLLIELNPDVKGKFFNQKVDKFFEEMLDILKSCNFVISTQKTLNQNLIIDKFCNQNRIPYICANTYGFYSLCSVWSPELAVIQSKPADVELNDLRLGSYQSFPALNAFSDSLKLNDPELSDAAHGHIPYPVILIQAMKQWKSTHNNEAPKNFQEKEAFKQNIKSLSRDFGKQGNFEEAVKYSYIIHKKNEVSEGVEQAFNWPEEKKDRIRNGRFWILIQALKIFYQQHGELPISGKVADMTADTTSFLALQKIYQQRMKADCSELMKILTEKIGVKDITLEDVENFCSNLMQIKVHQYKSLEKRLFAPDKEVIEEQSMDDESMIGLYFMLHGLQVYQNEKGLPGNFESKIQMSEEMKSLEICIKNQIEKEGAPNSAFNSDTLCQFGRSSNAVLHNICAIMGGIVSQEVIKIIVEQYTPLNNTIVFDGIFSKAQVFAL